MLAALKFEFAEILASKERGVNLLCTNPSERGLSKFQLFLIVQHRWSLDLGCIDLIRLVLQPHSGQPDYPKRYGKPQAHHPRRRLCSCSGPRGHPLNRNR